MSTTFWDRLEASITKRDSLVCVGLDPHPGRLPAGCATVLDLMYRTIDATAEVACAYKPNIAFFEAEGIDGLRALEATLARIPSDTPVILDAKRGDISSTADAYARAAFDWLGVDAITVNPYLGEDGVAPFLAHQGRGVFVLCKTSNPSAGEVQDWLQAGMPLYRHVAERARTWAKGGEIGLVIGATYPDAIGEIRAASAETWFLVPGVGAQGGDLDAVLRAGLRADGMGLLINSSRGVLYADDPRAAAEQLRLQINALRRSLAPGAAEEHQSARVRSLARRLFEAGCVQFGDFVLHSGAHSPVYVDLRRLASYPVALQEAARHYASLLEGLAYDRLAAIPYAAMPIGTAVSLLTGDPMIYPRREAKAYGTRRQIEGEFREGERIVLLDDLISSGGSKLEALAPLLEAGLVCSDVVVLINREQGGAEDLARHGYRLHAAVTLRQLVAALEEDGKVSAADAARVREYLEAAG
ncbi:MAG: orotidine-5'-phosphate decarboxylase [Chloroflexi bacterium]|nr:orotidine-5'-phosphate decarboxylase [Chloroflexota bacterium]